MKVKGISQLDLDWCVAATGLIYNHKPKLIGSYLVFTVRLRKCSDRYHRRFGLHAPSRPSRRGVSVCWHGHRDLMRRIFDRVPGAVLVSSLARYEGREGFERAYPKTAGRDIGSRAFPVRMDEACDCWFERHRNENA